MPSTPQANAQQPADAFAARLRRTELQHRPSSIPGGDIVQVLTEVPCSVEPGSPSIPVRRSGTSSPGPSR